MRTRISGASTRLTVAPTPIGAAAREPLSPPVDEAPRSLGGGRGREGVGGASDGEGSSDLEGSESADPPR